MTAKDKITQSRKMYIMQYGKEPTSVILGYEIKEEVRRELPHRFVGDGMEVYGMRIITDNNKPTKVEVGDFSV